MVEYQPCLWASLISIDTPRPEVAYVFRCFSYPDSLWAHIMNLSELMGLQVCAKSGTLLSCVWHVGGMMPYSARTCLRRAACTRNAPGTINCDETSGLVCHKLTECTSMQVSVSRLSWHCTEMSTQQHFSHSDEWWTVLLGIQVFPTSS